MTEKGISVIPNCSTLWKIYHFELRTDRGLEKYRNVVDRQPVALRMLGRLAQMAQMADVCIGIVEERCVEVQS